jgi:deoxyribodipyrimidine photo-lyase
MNQSAFDFDDASAPTGPHARASQRDWPATRAEGLRRIAAFAPRMGRRYAAGRNYDQGPDDRAAVSLLSPYVRRRLVTEAELVRAALDHHGPETADKFIQEVFWRGYWKGWLEARPSVWRAYVAGLARDRAQVGGERRLAKALAAAEEGRTGIACFDAWARELVETGYLHNHARMWFASIWIFTLDLPWRLGADFFLRHLLDGDPASNTLGWRWVAGLHTRGKHYVADAANIDRYTNGRFTPERGELAANPPPLSEDDATPPAAPVPPADMVPAGVRAALLITEEDCQPETLGLDLSRFVAAASYEAPAARSEAPVSEAVAAFDRCALADAAARAEAAGAPTVERLAHVTADDLARWAARAKAEAVVTAWVPVGPLRDRLDAARPALAAAGARLAMVRRPWDDLVWPHATAGFFKLRERIPRLLRSVV